MDKFSKIKRSEIMKRVKQKNTNPEMLVRRQLHKMGFRYRLHRKDLPGKPDITLPKYKSVVLVHGCFWHGHNCRRGKLPKTRKDFWTDKITGNRMRDKTNIMDLQSLGYRVLVVWECETKDKVALNQRLAHFLELQIAGGKSGATVAT